MNLQHGTASPNALESASLSQLRAPASPAAIPSLIPVNGSQCHFLGSITIGPKSGEGIEPLGYTLSRLSEWFGRHFSRPFRPLLAPSKLQEQGCLSYGDTHLSTLRYLPFEAAAEAPLVHAFALEHTDSYNLGRRWRTEIVLKELPNKDVKAYVGVHHGIRSSYFGPAPETPLPSTPTVVRRLIEDPKLECYYDVLKSFDAPLNVHDTAEQGTLFAKLLLHPGRMTPVVLMNRLSDATMQDFAWDPFSLTRACFGSGTVIVPSSSLKRYGPFLTALSKSLGAQGDLYVAGLTNGGVRVFQPRLNPEALADSKRHRYFHHSSGPEVPLWIQAGLRSTLRASLDEQGELSSFDGVLDAITRDAESARWEELRVRVSQAISPEIAVAAEQERENLLNLVTTLQQEVLTLRGEVRDLATTRAKVEKLGQDLDAAEQLLDAASERADTLEQTLEETRAAKFEVDKQMVVYQQLLESKNEADVARKKLVIPLTLPSEPHEAVSFLQSALAPRVVILDNAVDSSHDIPQSRLYQTWDSLIQLHEVLWPLHFGDSAGDVEENKVQTIPAKFYAQTGIEYTINESSMTNRDKSLMRQRRATIEGREFDFSAHLKIGNKEKDAVRIHIAVDDLKKRILVWHCGGHLDTAGTRRVS
jgi:hypothetical protein